MKYKLKKKPLTKKTKEFIRGEAAKKLGMIKTKEGYKYGS